MPQFEQARLKIKRADEHIVDVKKRIDAVVSSESQTSWIEVDANAGFQTIFYRLDKLGDLPEIALVIGDAIHNLRTALDYSWMAVANKLTLPLSGYSKFPVYATAEKLESGLHGINVDIRFPGLFKFIVSDIKPYETGNFLLFCLHQMDILDKHKLLIPTTNYGSLEGLKLHDDCGTIGSFGGEMGGVTRARIPIARKIENKGSVSFEIVFGEGPLKLMEVSDTLRVMSLEVSQVVERMETFIGC